MGLPKIQQPLFELTVPSTGKKVKYRPFTVKEEKILLMAQESNDINQVMLAIKQIVNNCVEKVNIEKLATFDFEYIMINLRARSVSNIVEFTIKDPETQEIVELSLDVNEIEVKKFDNHNKKIKVNDDIYIIMTYPTLNQINELRTAQGNKNEKLFKVMISCIESVVNGEEVLDLKNFAEAEIVEFVDSLSSSHMEQIKSFFDTMPVVRYEKEYTLKDGRTKKFIAEGTQTFFL